MKKLLLLIVFPLYACGIFAQDNDDYSDKEWRKQFVNLNFSNMKFTSEYVPDLESGFGVAATVGRTFFLHQPIADMVRFGIDAVWADLNYANYSAEIMEKTEIEKYKFHQAEFSVHVGPSVTIEPTKGLAVHAYFRYAPTFAGFYRGDNETFYGNYASMWVAGGNVSYNIIGIGIESKFGHTTYKPFGNSDNESFKADISSLRAYITLKF